MRTQPLPPRRRFRILRRQPVEGCDDDPVQRLHRQLRVHVKGADGLDLIAEKLEAPGLRLGGREHVQDAPAHGEFALPFHHGPAPVAAADQRRGEFGQRHDVTDPNRHEALVEPAGRRPVAQGGGGRDQDDGLAAVQPPQRQQRRRRIPGGNLLLRGVAQYGAGRPRRVRCVRRVVHETREVADQLVAARGIRRHHEHRRSPGGEPPRQQKPWPPGRDPCSSCGSGRILSPGSVNSTTDMKLTLARV